LTGRPGRFGSTPSLLVGIGGYTLTEHQAAITIIVIIIVIIAIIIMFK